MECPRCKLSLSRERYEEVEVDVCPGCWGMWLDSGELEAILESRELVFSEEEKKLVLEGRARRAQAAQNPVACPRCQVRMERLFLDPVAYLVIDRCPRHGIWLDTGEVKAVQALAEKSKEVSRLLIRKIRGQPPTSAAG
jgi:Zn-finger nucleic acid-binding protein